MMRLQMLLCPALLFSALCFAENAPVATPGNKRTPAASPTVAGTTPDPAKKDALKKRLNKDPFALRPGVRFKTMRLPRWNSDAQMVSYVIASGMEMLEGDVMSAQDIVARLFRKEGETVLTTKEAFYDLNAGVLKSRKNTLVETPDMTLAGRRVVANENTGEFFLSGPVKGYFNSNALKDRKKEAPAPK